MQVRYPDNSPATLIYRTKDLQISNAALKGGTAQPQSERIA